MITIKSYVNFFFIRWVEYYVKHKGKHSTVQVYLLTLPYWDLFRSLSDGYIIKEIK